MSEEHGPTATLTESLEPTAHDVQLVHEIILRAQKEPLADDKLSLLTAYEAVLAERGLNPKEDHVCYWLLLEVLKPDVEGDRLYTKFEHVLRSRGMEVVFADDEASTEATAPSIDQDESIHDRHSVKSTRSSAPSQQLTKDIEPEMPNNIRMVEELDHQIDEAPPYFAQLMQQAMVMDRRKLMRDGLDQLHSSVERLHQRNVATMQRQADAFYESRLKYKVLSHWQNLQQQLANDALKADMFHTQHKLLSAFDEMLDSARVNRLRAMEEERLRGLGLYKIAVASRESVFCRRLDARLKRKYLLALVRSCRDIAMRDNELKVRCVQFQSRTDTRLTQKAVTAKMQEHQQINMLITNADDQYESKLKTHVVSNWFQKTEHIVASRANADNMRHAYLMRKYLKRWHLSTKARRKARDETLYRKYRAEYKMRLARRCLRDMVNQCQKNSQMQKAADARREEKLGHYAHTIVVSWYNGSHAMKRQCEEATMYADGRLMKRALDTMAEKQQHISRLKLTADGLEELHTSRTSARCLTMMSRKIFEIRRRQQDADGFRERQEKQMTKTHFAQLRRAFAVRRGEGPLILPPVTPAQRRANQLNRLVSTTPVFAPRTSFMSRLREERGPIEEVVEEEETGDTG